MDLITTVFVIVIVTEYIS